MADHTEHVNKRFVAAVSAVLAVQRRLENRVTIHAHGTTWNGAAPSFGIEMPVEIFEQINDANAADLEALVRGFLDRLAAILAFADPHESPR